MIVHRNTSACVAVSPARSVVRREKLAGGCGGAGTMINVRVSERCVLTAKAETGRDRNGGALAYVPTTYSCTTRRSRPSDSRVRDVKQTHHTRRSDQTLRALPAGSAGKHMAEAVCRHSYGLVDSAAGQPELAPGTDPSSQPSNGPARRVGIISSQSERTSNRRWLADRNPRNRSAPQPRD